MVLAPEHPLVDVLDADAWPDGTPPAWTGGADDALRRRRGVPRLAASLKPTSSARPRSRRRPACSPARSRSTRDQRQSIPIFIADYVLMGYGTGAIMAVPGHDERDFEFAEAFEPADRAHRATAAPSCRRQGLRRRRARRSTAAFLDGLGVADAKRKIIEWLDANGCGEAHGHLQAARLAVQPAALLGRAVPDRLRRRRACRSRCPSRCCRWCCPRSTTSSPARSRTTTRHRCPSRRWRARTTGSRSSSTSVTARRVYRRETNTMPQWAGSCWYYLRYLDPTNENEFVDPAVERYWMGPQHAGDPGGVDLYVGGVEHAVLHLLYARFWHKVLFDLGHVSTLEPFQRLFNQGYILAAAYTDERGMYVEAVGGRGARRPLLPRRGRGQARVGKMGKSLKNARHARRHLPRLRRRHAAPLRDVHGPARPERPWETRGDRRRAPLPAAAVAQRRSTRRPGSCASTRRPPTTRPAACCTARSTRCAPTWRTLRFNTAIARLIELNNHLTAKGADDDARARSPSPWC